MALAKPFEPDHEKIWQDIADNYAYLLDEYKTVCENQDKEIEQLKQSVYISQVLTDIVNELINKYGDEAKTIAEEALKKAGVTTQS